MSSPPPHGLPVPGGVSERLWADAQEEAYRALQHPFVVALGLGTLDKDCFRHYVAQDAHFLHFFARAYAAALDKVGDTDPEAHVVLQQLLMGVHMELRLHGAYARQWNVDLESLRLVHPATQAYTDFLMDVAEDPETSVAEVLAAMVPCSRLYGFLGCGLAEAHPPAERRGNPYFEWIGMYSSFDYLVLPMQKEKLLDRLAAEGASYDRLRSLYRSAMELEVAFFSAQPGVPAARRVGLLVCDFDDTCSERDTIGTLLQAAVDAAVKRAPPAERPALQQKLEGVVAGLVANYTSKHAALLAEILPEAAAAAAAAGSGGGAGAAGHDEEALDAFVERLSDFDVAMNTAVVEAGVLAGLSPDDVAAAAAKVALKDGCRATLAAALAVGIPTHIISVNWSRDFVAAALGLPAAGGSEAPGSGSSSGSPEEPAAAAAPHGALAIHANELARGANGATDGGLLRRIECARDKGALFGRLLSAERAAADAAAAASAAANRNGSNGGATAGASVFVGDSATDVLPLLAADYGIVIGANKTLRRVLAAHGVRLAPLAAAPLDASADEDEGAPTVYEAAGWAEISAFLFGPEGPVGTAGIVDIELPGGAAGAADRGAPAAAAGGRAGASTAAARLPRVLTVAGSDSGGGAGIQADLKTVMALGCFGMSAITALTAQNSRGVQGVHPVPPEFLAAQIDSVLSDLGADAVKTGMLPDAAAVHVVAQKIKQYNIRHLVVDPVMISTSGHTLAGGGVAHAVATELLPLASLVTPNIPEAEALLGGETRIRTVSDMRDAARRLRALGPAAVLVKGGHMVAAQAEAAAARRRERAAGGGGAAAAGHAAGNGNGSGERDEDGAPLVAVDVLYDGERFLELRAPYVATTNTHGTGCTLGAASAAGLARGLSVAEAVREAKAYLTAALAGSAALRMGAGPQHPFHHGVGFVWDAEAAGAGGHDSSYAPPAAVAARGAGGSFSFANSSGGGAGAPDGLLRRASGRLGGGSAAAAAAAAAARHHPNPCDLRLYVVTDPGCNERAGRSLADAVAAAVAGGATIVQIREKDTDGGDFVAAARAALRICRAAGVPLLINDRVDVALAVGADGVHVGQGDIPARAVRRMLGPGALLGVSVKTPAEAVKAVADGADYLGAGAIESTSTKDASVIGLDGLAAVCSAVDIPVVAIGGVGLSNTRRVMEAGAAGVAVVSAVFSAPDAEAAARALRNAVDGAVAEIAEERRQNGEAPAAAAVGAL